MLGIKMVKEVLEVHFRKLLTVNINIGTLKHRVLWPRKYPMIYRVMGWIGSRSEYPDIRIIYAIAYDSTSIMTLYANFYFRRCPTCRTSIDLTECGDA